jgi:D-alanine-D-alanine ligase
MSKMKIGIIYGGRSTEHEISIRSALNVSQFLNKDNYKAVHIGISPKGAWFLMPEVSPEFEHGQPLHLRLNASDPGLFIQSGEKVEVDMFFPVLHGTDGEDGNIQGLLTAMELPFVGTGVLGSSLCMSKLITKQLLTAAGVPVVPFDFYPKSARKNISFQGLKDKLGLPFMAKAANLGSSVGVNKVKNEDDLIKAIEEAFTYDDIILFEEYIKGRELECAVIGNAIPQASLAGEIIVDPKYEFYTYKAKYLDPEAVQLQVPATIDEKLHNQIQQHSINAYKVLQCQDFARIDVFLAENGNIYINEINTIPGFTNASMFPMMWKERGIDNTTLITNLINFAIERYKLNSKQREYQVVN